MGNGTVPASLTQKVVSQAFTDSNYEVYIASKYLKPNDSGNIHIAPRWDFDTMLHEAVCFINHGGQNSICDGLLYGVPQIVVPGKVFERRYNAKSLTDNNAGILLEFSDFNADKLRAAAEIAINNTSMKENAIALGKKLASSGGINFLVSCILKQ